MGGGAAFGLAAFVEQPPRTGKIKTEIRKQ
jgi:hypothetical protein